MKDLTSIPKKYHSVFTTDWNKGNESQMTSLERMEIHNLFLEYNRWEIQKTIQSNRPVEENIIIGFVKD
jgi:hypothetical protein